MSNIQDSNPPEADEEPPSSNTSLDISVLIDRGVVAPSEIPTLALAARRAAVYRGCWRGELGVRITDDPTIREVNRIHLGHDEATDVVSFGYELCPPRVTGELITSAETAVCRADEYQWSAEAELLLYIIHGVLHITGMDDATEIDAAAMRRAETEVLMGLGITRPDRSPQGEWSRDQLQRVDWGVQKNA